MNTGYLVTEDLWPAKSRQADYPLLEGDLLHKEADGTYTKECPGMCVLGFELDDSQEASLKEVKYECWGLNYVIHDAS